MRKTLVLTCLLAFSMILVGCEGDESSSVSEEVTVNSVTVTGNAAVTVGQTLQLSASVDPSGANQNVTWTSLDEAKATVDANGLVTGVSVGEVTIRATSVSNTAIKGDLAITVEAAQVAEGVTANGTVHTLVDNRANAYAAYTPTGTKISESASLYQAISSTVDEGDRGSYVSKLAGDDSDVKMFVNNEKYNENMGDMFWYYQNGNQLAAYVDWKNTYFQDSKNLGATVVMNSPTEGVLTYYNGHETLFTNPEDASSNNVAVWSIQEYFESAATGNLVAYSGITKVSYEIDLTGVKFAPSLNEEQPTEAFFGFYTTDSYNTSHQQLRADTSTGDWYYAAGEYNFDASADTLTTDESVCLMTSTWNEAGYFVPDEDSVVVTMEKLTLKDNEGGDYIVDRITFDFPESGRKVVREYEIAALTQCGTIRFVNGLDIMTGGVVAPDYMNGSYFTGLKVTEATAYALAEMQDPLVYGNTAVLDAGEYDVLNANPASAARYQTYMYNPAFNSLEIVEGADVYSHSFNANVENTAYDPAIANVKSLIAELPAKSEVVIDDQAEIEACRAAYDALHLFEKSFISEEELKVLSDAEVGLAVAKDPQLGAVTGLLTSLGSPMDYTSYAAILEKASQIETLVTSYEGLSSEVKASLDPSVETLVYDWEKAVTVPADSAQAAQLAILYDVVLGRTYDGQTLTDWNIDGSGYVWTGAGQGLNSLIYVAGAGRTAMEALETVGLMDDLPSDVLADITTPTVYTDGSSSFAIGLNFLRAYGDVCTILDEIAATATGWAAAWQITFADYENYGNNSDINVNIHGQDTSVLDFEVIRPQLDLIAEYWNAPNVETWNFKNSVGYRTITVARRWDAYLKPILADARCPYMMSGHGLALKAI